MDPDRLAKELGVDPIEFKKVNHMGRQMASDYHNGRPVSKEDQAYLLDTLKKGGTLAGEVYWNVAGLRGSDYAKVVAKQAVKATKSDNEHEAFSAIEFLQMTGDYRWRALAESYPRPSKLMAIALKYLN